MVLVRIKDVVKASKGLVAGDDKGHKLLLRDSPLARYRSTNNLETAAGAALDGAGKLAGPASLLLRLYRGLADEAIYGQPFALVLGQSHIRLGM
jgi:hypothetical protein